MNRQGIFRSSLRAQQGAALLGAIVITAIIVALTASIGQASRFSIASTSRLLEAMNAEDQFAALEYEARLAMREDAAAGNTALRMAADSRTPLIHEGVSGDARAALAPVQGLFNLNNLVPRARTSARGNAGAASNASQATASDSGLPRATTSRNAAPTDATSTPAAEDAPALPTLPASVSAPPMGADSFTASSPPGLDAANAGGMSSGDAPEIQLTRSQRLQQIAMLPAAAPWLLDQDASSEGGANDDATEGEQTATAEAQNTDTAADASRAASNRREAVNALNDLAVMSSVDGMAARGSRSAAAGTTTTLSEWEVAVIRFSLLLNALELEQDLLPAILDWVDEDNDTRYPGGAEDDFYMDEEAPYRAANRAFSDISELRLVRGIDEQTYTRLEPFVTVLPLESDIDVNHAPAEVLMALGPGIDETTAQMLIDSRSAQPYMTIEQFVSEPALAGRPVYDGGLTVDSTWFRLNMHANSGDTRLSASALLARNTPDEIETVSRRRGYLDE